MTTETSAAASATANAPDARARLQAGLQYEQAGMWAKAHAIYERLLTAHPEHPIGIQAQIRIACTYRAQGQWDHALADARTARDLAQAIGEVDLWAEAVNVEIGVHLLRGEHAEVERIAVATLAHPVSPRLRGLLLHNRGAAAAQQGHFDVAETRFAEAVQSFREADYELGITFALNSRSAAAHDAGRPVEALALARDAFAIAERILAYDQVMLAIENQADPLVSLGQLNEAMALVGQALGHFASIGDRFRHVECLEVLGRIVAAHAEPSKRAAASDCYNRGLVMAREMGAATLVTRLERRLREMAAAS